MLALMSEIAHLGPEDTPYPLRRGNQVVPWIDGGPFYTRLLEACRQARGRVWAIVSFIQPGFSFPSGPGFFELLDECANRGVEVRVLFWRNPHFFNTKHIYQGDRQTHRMLEARGSRWLARWDRSPDAGHCHHQKAFVIDAGGPDARAFVGGMVLSQSTVAWPGHDHPGKHDVFVELAGPVVEDAASNFIERWNGARMDREAPPYPDARRAGDIAVGGQGAGRGDMAAAGEVPVQLSRTVRPGLYPGTPDGEEGIWQQYRLAFQAAERTIYIENQHPGELQLLQLMRGALERGVAVTQVVPELPMDAIIRERMRGSASPYAATFDAFDALAEYGNFTLVGYAHGAQYRPVYVHAKVCIIDGGWATCGSANLVDISLERDHTELNASFWHRPTCMALLEALLAEHGPLDLTGGDDGDYLRQASELARENARRRAAGAVMRGLANALDVHTYGRR